MDDDDDDDDDDWVCCLSVYRTSGVTTLNPSNIRTHNQMNCKPPGIVEMVSVL